VAGSQRHWLVEPLPGYAPERHPVEALWANLQGFELANTPSTNRRGS
jgi:hypothetical protein